MDADQMAEIEWLRAECAKLRGRNAGFEVAAVPLALAGYTGSALAQVEAALADLAEARAMEPRRCLPCVGLTVPRKDCPECQGRGAVLVSVAPKA